MNYEVQKHEIARGKILKILAPVYPHPVDAVMLRRLLDDFGMAVSEETLLAYIAYLEERGYVRTSVRKHTDIRMIEATALGLDVVDRRKEDEGVDVGY